MTSFWIRYRLYSFKKIKQNKRKRKKKGGRDYVYIGLVGYIALLCNTRQKGKSNLKSIYFQKIMV
jgi:hypothetical protein